MKVEHVRGLTSLKLLSLHNNKNLEHLPSAILEFFADYDLQYFSIYSCKLNKIWINPKVALKCPPIRAILAFDNPFTCDCHIRPFIHFINAYDIDLDLELSKFKPDLLEKRYNDRDRKCFQEKNITRNFPKDDDNVSELVVRHLKEHFDENKAYKLKCAAPYNRLKQLVNSSVSDLAKNSEEFFTCPYEAEYVTVSVVLGLAFFATTIPLVFGIIMCYLTGIKFYASVTKYVAQKHREKVDEKKRRDKAGKRFRNRYTLGASIENHIEQQISKRSSNEKTSVVKYK